MSTFLLLLLSAAATTPPAAQPAAAVRVGGSTSLAPITRVMEAGFYSQARSIHLAVHHTGTAEGLKQLCAGEVDIAGASRPVREDEVRACDRAGVPFVELALAYDEVTVIAHPEATWLSSITLAELRRLWAPEAQGRVTRWSQVREGWPDTPVRLVAPEGGSGTRDSFAETLGMPRDARGQRRLRTDVIVAQGSPLVQTVAQTPGALSFVGSARLQLHPDMVRRVEVEGEVAGGGAGNPLQRPLLLYVSAHALQRADVASFAQFYLANAARVVRKVGYTVLSPVAYRDAIARLKARYSGTQLGGGEVGGAPVRQKLMGRSPETAAF